jgi:hypothetical protein
MGKQSQPGPQPGSSTSSKPTIGGVFTGKMPNGNTDPRGAIDYSMRAGWGWPSELFGLVTGAPDTPNYAAGAQQQGQENRAVLGQQTQANRPNQQTPFGFSNWTQDAAGNWTQNTGLSGPLGGAAGNLNAQAAQNLLSPMDWNQLGKLDDGSAARDQAINASYDAQAARLNPMFANREDAMRTELLNQGLDPNSQAARGARSDFSAARNDAFGGAMNSAIREGTAAQQATFTQNLAARNQKLMEMLKRRGQPLDELNALQGFTQMPGFMGAGQAQATPYMQAMLAQSGFDMDKWLAQQKMMGDMFGGLGELGQAGASAGGALAPLLAASDERVKTNVTRLDSEAIPGVPWATWDYLPEYGGARSFGVIAQDLQKVRPELVHDIGGVLHVDYSFLEGR